MAKPIKASVFLDPENHRALTNIAKTRRLSLTKLIAEICGQYLAPAAPLKPRRRAA